MKLAERINQALHLGAEHAYYFKDGTWYHRLKQFPAVLIDSEGYLRFETEDIYTSTEGVNIKAETNQVHIPAGIASIPGYQPFSDEETAVILELEYEKLVSERTSDAETSTSISEVTALAGDDYEEDTVPIQYDISSYGADYSVDGLVKRLRRGDIFMPDFQRDYVWNQNEASRLIESLLLGLPIPGVFLAKEATTNKLFVIDGQQRLRSIQYFYDEYFNPKPSKATKKVFKLTKVQSKFEGKTYSTLDESDRIRLDDSIIHATVVKQESPDGDNTSIYHVFERLNTGGRKLTPQEIRAAIYYGKLNKLIFELNNLPSWRMLYGPVNVRLRDQEIILRILALFYDQQGYKKPMVEFLNKFNKKYQDASDAFLTEAGNVFKKTLDFLFITVGRVAFRPEGSLNVAAIEAVSVGTARLLERNPNTNPDDFSNQLGHLFKDGRFLRATQISTSDEAVLTERHALVGQYFAQL